LTVSLGKAASGKMKNLSMSFSLSNKYAKHFCNRTVQVQLVVEDVVTCFFGTQCT